MGKSREQGTLAYSRYPEDMGQMSGGWDNGRPGFVLVVPTMPSGNLEMTVLGR